MNISKHYHEIENTLRSNGGRITLNPTVLGNSLHEGVKQLCKGSLQLQECTLSALQNESSFTLNGKGTIVNNINATCEITFSDFDDSISADFKTILENVSVQELFSLKLIELPLQASFLKALSFSDVEIRLLGDSKIFSLWSETSAHEFAGWDPPGLTLKNIGLEYGRIWNSGPSTTRILFTTQFLGQTQEFSVLFLRSGEIKMRLDSFVDLNTGIGALLNSLGKWSGLSGNAQGDIFPSIPEAILKLPKLELGAMELTIDPNKKSLTTFEASVQGIGRYELIPGVVSFEDTRLVVSGIRGSYGWTKEVSLHAAIPFGVGHRFEISAVLSSLPQTNWTFRLGAGVDINKLAQLDKLPLPFKVKDILLPEQFFKVRRFTLEHLEVVFNPAKKNVESLHLDLNFEMEIQIIPGLVLSNPRIDCLVDQPLSNSERTISGYIFSTITLAGCSFHIAAEKEPEHWLFKGYTGEDQKLSFRKFAGDMAKQLNVDVNIDELLPEGFDVSLRDLSLSYHTGNKEIEFTGISETRLKLPFLANPDTEIDTYLNIICRNENGKYKFEWQFTGTLKIAASQFAVRCIYQPGQSSFTTGWKARKGEKGLTLKAILATLGIDADPGGPFAVELTEVVFDFTEKDKQLTLAAYTSGKSLAFLIARKVDNKWVFAAGLDYDVSKTTDEGEVKELADAARTAGLTKLSLMYAGMDLEEFELPSLPVIPGTGQDYPAKGRTINVAKGLHFVGEVRNITLPAIGRIQPDLKHFYIAVSKTTKVDVKLKGTIRLTLPETRYADFKFDSAYSGGDKPTVTFSGEAIFSKPTGFNHLANAILPPEYVLPAEIKWGTLTEAALTIDTAKKDFKLTLNSDGTPWGLDTVATISFKQIGLTFEQSKFSFSAEGKFASPLLKDALQNEDGSIGGKIDLILSKEKNEFSFTPSGLKFTTPPITYYEAKEVQGSGPVGSIKKELFAAATVKALTFKFDKTWEASAAAQIQFNGVPYPVNQILREAPIIATFSLGSNGVKVTAQGEGLPQITIPDLSALITQESKVPLPPIGEGHVRLTSLGITIGKNITLSATAGIGLPGKLNEALGFKNHFIRTWKPGEDTSLVQLTISLGTAEISGKIVNSPFIAPAGITEDGEHIIIDLDKVFGEKDLGAITFTKPKLSFETSSGSFKLSGGYEIDEKRGMAIPLRPLKKVLEWLQLKPIGDALPAALPVKSISLTPKAMADFFKSLGITLDPGMEAALGGLVKYSERLPQRFQDYLSISIPRGFDLNVNISSDGGVAFSLNTKGDPLQFLLPTGLMLTGVRLQKLSFGTAFGGSLLKLDFSAEVDQFDPLTLVGSILIDDIPGLKPHLPASKTLQNTFIAKDLLIFIIYYSGVPIPIPLFYSQLKISRVGLEGFEFQSGISFPLPKINVMKALTLLKELKESFTTGKDVTVTRPIKFAKGEIGSGENNITFSGGPLYLRLPKYIAKEKVGDEERGLTIGITEEYELLNVLNLAGILFNGIRRGSVGYLIQSLDAGYRMKHFEFSLFGVIKTSVAWALATPAEFSREAYTRLGPGLTPERAKDMLRIVPAKGEGRQGVSEGDDEGMVVFLQGQLEVGDALSITAAGALSVYGRQFGSGIQFTGSAFKGLIRTELMGLVKIEANKSLLLEGRTSFYISDKTIFMGSLRLENDTLEAEFKSEIGTPNAPWQMRGKLTGKFKNDLFFLNGTLDWNLLIFSGKGEALIHFSPKEQEFNVSGDINLGKQLSLRTWVGIKQVDGNFAMAATFNGKALNLLEVDLNGILTIGSPNWALAGNGKLKILQKEVASVSFSISNTELRLANKLDLFPGIPGIAFKGELNCVAKPGVFDLQVEADFVLGPFSAGAKFLLYTSANESYARLELYNFFGSDITLALNASPENGVKLVSSASTAIKLLLGAVRINAANNPNIGPYAELEWNAEALQKFIFSGEVSILGVVNASAQVNYLRDKQLMNAVVKASVEGSPFTAGYTLTTSINKNHFSANTALSMNLNIGRVLSDIVYNATWIWIQPAQINIGFSLNDFKIEILGDIIPSNPDEDKLREELRKIREKIRELEKKFNATSGTYAAAIKEVYNVWGEVLKRAAKEPKGSKRAEILTKRYNRITTIYNTLLKLKKSFDTHNGKVVEMEKNIGTVKEARLPIADNITRVFELEKLLDDSAKAWKQQYDIGQNYDNSKRLYEQVYRPEFYTLCYDKLWLPKPLLSKDRIPDNIQHWIYWRAHEPHKAAEHNKNYLHWRGLMTAHFDKLLKPYDDQIAHFKKEADKATEQAKEVDIEIKKLLNEAQAIRVMNELDEKYQLENEYWKKGLAYHVPIPEIALETLVLNGEDAQYANHQITYSLQLSFTLPGLPQVNIPGVKFVAPLAGMDFSQPILNNIPAIITNYLVQNLGTILYSHFQSWWEIAKWLWRTVTGTALSSEDVSTSLTITDLIRGYGEMDPEIAKIVVEAMHGHE